MSLPCNIDLHSQNQQVAIYKFDLEDDFFVGKSAVDISSGKVEAEVTVKKVVDSFDLTLAIKGKVVVPCDRCLEELEVKVENNGHLVVEWGDELLYDEEEKVVVPFADEYFDISWYLYELIALALPTVKVHKKGECNKAMIDILQTYDKGAETEDKPIDPRWEALKKIKNN